MKRCVAGADDFGLNAAVDDGILALLEAGVLTATSCLTRSPRWPDAARRLRTFGGASVDIGVHVDLTEFDPLAASHAALVIACCARRIDARRLRAALQAQFEAFEDALGRAPDFVDGHRHVHQLPGVREALIDVLTERYPRRLPWVRVSRAGWESGWKGRFISGLGSAALAARCRAVGAVHNARLLGIYDFTGDAQTHRERLSSWWAHAADGDVLMCHPAARVERGDPIGTARRTEYEALTGAWWKRCLDTNAIRLCRGGEWTSV